MLLSCSENMQQIHTSAWVFPVNLLHILRTTFYKNTSRRLLLFFQDLGVQKSDLKHSIFIARVWKIWDFEVLTYFIISQKSLKIFHIWLNLLSVTKQTLREKCPNAEFFLLRIFSHSDWIRKDTSYLLFGHFSHTELLSSFEHWSLILVAYKTCMWRLCHYVKSVQTRCNFWSLFSCIRTEYGDSLH